MKRQGTGLDLEMSKDPVEGGCCNASEDPGIRGLTLTLLVISGLSRYLMNAGSIGITSEKGMHTIAQSHMYRYGHIRCRRRCKR